MASFSERLGLTPVPAALQTDSINDDLQHSLWNVVYQVYSHREGRHWDRVAETIALKLRKLPIDRVPYSKAAQWVRDYFYELPWWGVYNLCEFIVKNHYGMTVERGISYGQMIPHPLSVESVRDAFNHVLQLEKSGYRFVNTELVPISSQVEMQSIADAVSAADRAGLDGAALHLRAALEAFGKKPAGDYRGTVQESIHAVESVAKRIDGKASITLDPALKALASKGVVHPSLQQGFGKIYGYTSDADGIRHGAFDVPNVDFADAKYMLVSCSAFVHYLIQKADAAGLLPKK